ncbi:peroxidase family protein [Bosea sp. NPDC003192]|uniref:peroxidase family protein n=1 Tax=Bosea sp. NPDC003192 TaxID=3390551 RepID=UPI003D057F53
MVNLVRHDLEFILRQIKIAEAHSSGTPLTEIHVDANGNVVPAGTPGAVLAISHPLAPYGLRTVDGSYNNMIPGREEWGAADNPFSQLTDPYWRNEDDDAMPFPGYVGPDADDPTRQNNDYGDHAAGGGAIVPGTVVDADPRIISNLIVDQTLKNPAAIYAALVHAGLSGAALNTALQEIVAAKAALDAAIAAAPGQAATIAALEADVAAAEAVLTDAQSDAAAAAVALADAQVADATAQAELAGAQLASDAANAALVQLLTDGINDPVAEAAAFAAAQAAQAELVEEQGEAAAAASTLAAAGAAVTAADAAVATAEDTLSAAQADLAAAQHVENAQADLDTLLGTHGVEMEGESLIIPNVAPDEGLSAPFNSWFTLFGQFFDHGLDLVAKGGGTVYIPLQPDDPLYNPASPRTNFMVVTRTNTDAPNLTTPWVDQNQTYSSHASKQLFMREYAMVDGEPLSTGKLLSGERGLATWADVKEQAADKLGFLLTDKDIGNIPLFAMDEYGEFIRGPNGLPQLVAHVGLDGAFGTSDDILVEGNLGAPVDPSQVTIPPGHGALSGTVVNAIRTGHAFIDDIAHTAATVNSRGQALTADADDVVGLAAGTLVYDDELLDAHYVTGDGRGNENIGLSAVHHVFHSEHNHTVDQVKAKVLASGDLAFISEWLQAPITALPADLATLRWDGERLFQAARFSTEMQYQHLVFEEFARKIQPDVDAFVFNPSTDIDPAIFAEFAHVVYRFGHSMLRETVDIVNADGTDASLKLFDAFLNPLAFGSATVDHDTAAGAIVRGMTAQVGNEIDEFVTNVLRNQLLGIPLDLAAINIARGRDTGIPPLNLARAQFKEIANGDSQLDPYTSWTDFALNLKNPASIVNFIAAYGTHSTITGALTADAKREAAMKLVFGGTGAPADRLDFLGGRGIYASDLGGLNLVDLWVGGLAEKKMAFGGMLGSTFSFIFELQLENLQNADRFYYLSRVQGLNFLNELENNSLAKMVLNNTDLGETGFALPGDIFSVPDHVLYMDHAQQNRFGYDDPQQDDPFLEALSPMVERRDAAGNLIDPETNPTAVARYIRVNTNDHVLIQGTDAAETIIAGGGDDSVWGKGGNDRIEAGYGVDKIHGGDGDDIITNSGTDIGEVDMLHGEAGNDVIHGGSGLALIFGNEGQDVIITGPDGKEAFGGLDNDFILGGEGGDFLLGNEGDDWIEGGGGFDTTAGDNSELFFNSTILGHDVMFAGTDEHDFDAESGDDIMVQGESVMRNEGMLGFDWAIHKGNAQAADSDLTKPIFTTDEQDILRDRFDAVEALSGWDKNDHLWGDDRGGDVEAPAGAPLAGAENTMVGHELSQAGVDRIRGLREIMGDLIADAPATGDLEKVIAFNSGNILLGGGGSDVIEGRGGDDFIDGDAWLNVRIAIVDENGDEVATADGLSKLVTVSESLRNTAPFDDWHGEPLHALMLSGAVNPIQLQIVREILETGPAGEDVAVFNDSFLAADGTPNYTITHNADGTVTVAHVNVTTAVDPETGRQIVSDGVDTLRNVEYALFADGARIKLFSDPPIDIRWNAVVPNNNNLPGNGLIATLAAVDPDSTSWTYSLLPGGSPGFTVSSAGLVNRTGGTMTANQAYTLNIRASDELGKSRDETFVIRTGSDGADTITVSSALSAHDHIIYGDDGNDILTGGSGNDTLFGQDENDILTGGDGDDLLVGGSGTDTMNGQGGNDTIVYDIDNGGANEGISGGADTDTLAIVDSGTGAETLGVAYNGTRLTGVEAITALNADIERITADLGAGTDTLAYTSSAAITVDLAAGTASGFASIANIENVSGGTGNDTFSGNAGDNSFTGNGGTDRVVYAGNATDYSFGLDGSALEITSAATGTDTLNTIEQVQFGATVYSLSQGTNGGNTLNGGTGADLILGFNGNDTINGNAGADLIRGGDGNDTINAGDGNDTIVWNAGDDRDIVNGGANTDTFVVNGDAGGETYRVYTRAAWDAVAGNDVNNLNAATQIVITRNGTNFASVIGELTGIEEIVINTGAGNDQVLAIGDFSPTSLSTSTITINGSDGNDSVDISSLTSAHRILFRSNGGNDTIVGTLRPQDVIELMQGSSLADYTTTNNPNGTTTLSNGTHSITFASTGTPVIREEGELPRGAFEITPRDLEGLKRLINGQRPFDDDDDADGALGPRTISGAGNNEDDPSLGASDTPFIRLTEARYGAYDAATNNRALNPIFEGLDPRAISNILGSQEAGLPKASNEANIFFMSFGQYFDHGLDFIPKNAANGTVQIGAPGIGTPGQGNPADLTRGEVHAIGADGVPQHLNKTTAFVDQNQAYGSHALVTQFLREGDGNGGLTANLLKGAPDPSNPDFNLLPTLREAIQHHWANNTLFVDPSLPGGQIHFRDYYSNYPVSETVTGDLIDAAGGFDPQVLAKLASNFMSSGQALLLDSNPFINALDHYVAGDGRANENFALTSMHTIWARNHNFHAEQLKEAGFDGTEQELFEAAKVINEAEYQRVVFNEFADMLLGGMRGLGDHGNNGYNPDADPGISHEFAAAVYRVGHSLIGQTLTVLDENGQPKQVALFDAFLNPSNDPDVFNAPLSQLAQYGYVPQPGYEQYGVNPILAGIAGQAAEQVDFNIVDAVRNDLVRIQADLFSFNVARGRDVGLGTLNQIRADLAESQNSYIAEAVGYAGDLSPYSSWEDFQARNGLSDAVIAQFKQAYPDLVLDTPEKLAAFVAANPDITLVNGNTVKGIDRVDLWVGGLAETHINGGVVGQTFWVVLHEQFDRLQEADRFYYKDRLEAFDFYEDFIDGQEFSDIVARVTGLGGLDERIFEVNDEDDAGNDDEDDEEDDDDAGSGDGDDDEDDAGSDDDEDEDDEDDTGSGDDDEDDEDEDDEDDDGAGSGDDDDDDDDCGCDDEDDTGTPAPNPSGGAVRTGTGQTDLLIGTAGADSIVGLGGDDVLTGEAGDDNIAAGEGADFVDAGAGTDTVFLGAGDDHGFGGDGNDALYGEAGADRVFGGAGNDRLDGGAGDDTVVGGAGNDLFIAAVGDGNDSYHGDDLAGGTGIDTLDMSVVTASVTVDLGSGLLGRGSAVSVQTGQDTLWGIENVATGSGNDTITASNAVNVIEGGAGDDVFRFNSAQAADGDTILDFEPGDRLDLSGIDAHAGLSGNQGFTLVNGPAFTGSAQLMVTYETRADGDYTVVSGNTGGDQEADFQISLKGTLTLGSGNIAL